MSRARRKLGRPTRAPALPWPEGRRLNHRAMRTCAGCGNRDEGNAMRRFGLREGSDALEWRDGGGRGSYLHADPRCESLFVTQGRSSRALRLTLKNEVRAALVALRG